MVLKWATTKSRGPGLAQGGVSREAPGGDQGGATAITLPHLDRGTYRIGATVTDSATGQSRSTNEVTFYVRQPSELSPQHQKP